MQPAGDLVTQPGQVTVPLGPHLQHRRVVLGGHLAAVLGPQRRDRHRQGIVRVVLVRVPGLQQPHPGRQLRLHVQDPLAGGDELLGQQPAQPGSALDRPGPLRPRRRPRHQLLRPAQPRRGPGSRPAAPPPGRSPPPCASPYAGPRRSSLLSWHAPSRSSGKWRTWRACLIPDLLALAPLSSHATARTGRLAPRSKARPHAVGRRFGSQPVGPHERYGTTAAPSGTIRPLCVGRTAMSVGSKRRHIGGYAREWGRRFDRRPLRAPGNSCTCAANS